MSTTLCDVHVGIIRKCGYSSLEEWLADPKNSYIGRGNVYRINGKSYPEKGSIWANPYKSDKPNQVRDGNLETVLIKYWNYITKKIVDENLFEELRKLKGKNLGCWCAGDRTILCGEQNWTCHGQILLYLINYYFP